MLPSNNSRVKEQGFIRPNSDASPPETTPEKKETKIFTPFFYYPRRGISVLTAESPPTRQDILENPDYQLSYKKYLIRQNTLKESYHTYLFLVLIDSLYYHTSKDK